MAIIIENFKDFFVQTKKENFTDQFIQQCLKFLENWARNFERLSTFYR